MKTKILLLGCFIFAIHTSCAKEERLNDGIIKSVQKNMFNVSVAAYAFCVPEFVSVLQKDATLLPKFCANMSERLDYLKQSKDIYYAELLKIQLLKDSLMLYYSINKADVVQQLIDSLKKVPMYTLKQKDLYLFLNLLQMKVGLVQKK